MCSVLFAISIPRLDGRDCGSSVGQLHSRRMTIPIPEIAPSRFGIKKPRGSLPLALVRVLV